MSVSPPPVQGDAIINTDDTFFDVPKLNNSLLNVPNATITVTASNRAGQGNVNTFLVQLPISLSKYCIYTNVSSGVYVIC